MKSTRKNQTHTNATNSYNKRLNANNNRNQLTTQQAQKTRNHLANSMKLSRCNTNLEIQTRNNNTTKRHPKSKSHETGNQWITFQTHTCKIQRQKRHTSDKTVPTFKQQFKQQSNAPQKHKKIITTTATTRTQSQDAIENIVNMKHT